MLKCNKCCCVTQYSYVLCESRILDQLEEGRVVVLDTIPSTNQYILDNFKRVKLGDVYVTDYQTQGRGRYGKSWITPNKQSLCLSVYWKLYRNLFSIVELSLIVSFTVADVLKKMGVPKIKIKWPNDLYVGDKKLAGILIEVITNSKDVFHLAIGIGINMSICIRTKLKIKMSKNWIDLKDIGVNLDHNVLVATLVKKLRKTLSRFNDNHNILRMNYWQSLNYLYGKSIELFSNNNIDYGTGTVLGISSNGALLVVDAVGKVCHFHNENLSIRVL